MLGELSGEVSGGHPDRQVAGDPVDACLVDDLVFAVGGVASDDFVTAFVQDRDGGEPGRVVFVGLDDDEGVSESLRSSISMNNASSDGSSIWSLLSLSAR